MRPWCIYVLKDPRNGAVRYVGMTHNKTRLNEHVFSVKRCRTHKASWIKTLLREGLRPLMESIETGLGEGWVVRERYWIAEYRRRGADLTNHTEGGEGTLGWSPDASWRAAAGERAKLLHTGKKRSIEARANMSAAGKRRMETIRQQGLKVSMPPKTPETLKRMADAQRGKKASAKTREKLSQAHRNPSPETRSKLAKAASQRPKVWLEWFAKNQVGKPKSAEHRLKIAAARKAAWDRKKGAVTSSHA